jgi:predicted nucleic acid-binding protein
LSGAFYVDSSAILRAVLEQGLTPYVEERLDSADLLITSRLALVETARVLLRLRRLAEKSEAFIADAERALRGVWKKCEVWELTREVCDLAEAVAPNHSLRSLDAIHLATFSLARREIAGLSFLTTDRRLEDAASGA